jgi:hypothetical protein
MQPTNTVNLSRWRHSLAVRLQDLPIEVSSAPFGYDGIDDLPGVPEYPVCFERAIVLCAVDAPQHGFEPEHRHWARSRKRRTRRYFRVNEWGVLSEVLKDGHHSDLFVNATPANVAGAMGELYGKPKSGRQVRRKTAAGREGPGPWGTSSPNPRLSMC